MKRNFSNEKINQLSTGMFGIFYKMTTEATRLSIYKVSHSNQNCEMPLLP
ncbi:hypothetical protein SAMN05421578_107209 [Paenibacillus macquariensis]|uniref:Uncharacterized protein n=1 Tax=Paenibacillus macquariensis TaxID=948756 RepID=A0ABY1K1R8_9BACL|nr:hypothetical protein SAMN05421578_107209 [Paenibacillus macquariensis]